MSRCRARCCRASANGRACRPRWSTPIWSRCWCAISRISIRGLDAAGVCDPPAFPDAIERRRDAVLGRDRRRPHRAHAVLRSGRRAPRPAPIWPRTRRAPGLVTLDMGGTSADIAFIEGGAPLEVTEGVDRAPPGRRAGARHDHDLGRRRLDRVDRRRRISQCRSAERRRRSGPGLLRPRRHAPDRHRRRSRLRLSQSGLFPRRRAAARCHGGARRARCAHRRAAEDGRAWKPLPASSASSTCAWPTRCGCSRPSAASISPPSRCCRSAAPAPCTQPRSRTELGMRRILVPPRPGAFSALGLLCTDVVHDYVRSELRATGRGHAPITLRRSSRHLKEKARARAATLRAWIARRRASRASSICATPARATSCARRSTDCLANG